MNYKMIGRFLGRIVSVEAAFLLPAMAISIGFGHSRAALAFLLTFGIMAAVSAFLYLTCRKAGTLFGPREGLVCVGMGWTLLSLLGALPFVFSGEIPRYIDAFFETVSGFTTTGSSILSAPESLTEGILYWRSFSHWLGGMGVLVFLLAIGGGTEGYTMHLLRAESPGPDVGKLVPKMKKTAAILYMIYIALTVVNVIFLLCGGMNWLDALCTAFGTAGTGGFGTKNDSLASMSPYLQNVTTVFMALFGVNFSCYYLLLLGNWRSVVKDEELRTYLLLILGAVAILVWNIRPLYGTFEETLRHAAFQVSSIITTTGYGSTDFDTWPMLSKAILLMLMLVGACAGSTGGGFKVARLLLVLKNLRRNIRKIMNPRQVQKVRINSRSVSEQVVENTNAYLAAYMVIIVISTLIVSFDDMTFGSTLSAVLACFNNIGPGIEAVGPTCNFGHLTDLSKLTLIWDMLAGRLEIFPILILFSRTTWTK